MIPETQEIAQIRTIWICVRIPVKVEVRGLEWMEPCPKASWFPPEAEIIHHILFWPEETLWSNQPETTRPSHGYWMDLKWHKKDLEINKWYGQYIYNLGHIWKTCLTLYLPLGVFIEPLESSFMGEWQTWRLGLLCCFGCKSVIIQHTILEVSYHLFCLLE